MNKPTFIRIAAALLLGAASLTAFAAQRTFVASYGLDTNTCTLTAPCRTLQRAVDFADTGGEAVVLDSAGYGIFQINKAVSVIAPPGIYAGVTVPAGQIGVAISTGAGAKVVLRGLSIIGQGGFRAVHVVSNSVVEIQNCDISNMSEHAIQVDTTGAVLHVVDSVVRSSTGSGININAALAVHVSGSRIQGNATGIWIVGGTPEVFVSDTRVTQNSTGIVARAGKVTLDRVQSDNNNSYNLHLDAAAATTVRATVRDSRFWGGNSTSVFVDATSTGSFAHLTVDNSESSGNSAAGFFANGPSAAATMIISRSVASENGNMGVGAVNAARVYVRGSTIVRNFVGLSRSDTAVLISCGDNLVRENGSNFTGLIDTITCGQ